MFLTTKKFWSSAGERAIKTFAQSAIAVAGAGAFDLFHVGWSSLLGVSLGAAVLSLLTSVASGTTGTGSSGGTAVIKVDSAQFTRAVERAVKATAATATSKTKGGTA